MPILEVQGLEKVFGRRKVLKGVSFQVNKGEVVGLLGPNGAGKTTSFRMATGQIRPDAGHVIFNGEDITELPMYQRARKGMGYLSQEPSVFKKLTVENNILAILEALPQSRILGRKLTKTERWQRTNEALKRFKLEHVRKNIAGRCSGGEKRRLEIARCLVCEPLLILLDEPFAAVDPITTEDIRQNIRELANAGIGILITDHNVREVFRTADRVYLITDGQVVTDGTPQQLINDEVAIKAYLGRSFEEDGFTRHLVTKIDTLSNSKSVMTKQIESKDSASGRNELIIKDCIDITTQNILTIEKLRKVILQLENNDMLRDITVALIDHKEVSLILLLEILETGNNLMRYRAYEILKYIIGENVKAEIDPYAPDEIRYKQIAHLRSKLGQI